MPFGRSKVEDTISTSLLAWNGTFERNEGSTHDGVVVLKVASTAFGLKGSPKVVLGHGVGLSCPAGEVLSVEGELRLELLDRVGVVQEEDLINSSQLLRCSSHRYAPSIRDTYSAVTSLEAIELLLSLRELLLRNLRLQDLLDKFPELLVLIVKQDNNASGLRIETAGDVKDVVSSNLLNTSIRDGDLVGDLVDGSAVLASLEEVHGRGHCCCSRRVVEM